MDNFAIPDLEAEAEAAAVGAATDVGTGAAPSRFPSLVAAEGQVRPSSLTRSALT